MAADHLEVLAGPQTLRRTGLPGRAASAQESLVALLDRVELGKSPFKNPVKKN
jgi:hypothetical protein